MMALSLVSHICSSSSISKKSSLSFIGKKKYVKNTSKNSLMFRNSVHNPMTKVNLNANSRRWSSFIFLITLFYLLITIYNRLGCRKTSQSENLKATCMNIISFSIPSKHVKYSSEKILYETQLKEDDRTKIRIQSIILISSFNKYVRSTFIINHMSWWSKYLSPIIISKIGTKSQFILSEWRTLH